MQKCTTNGFCNRNRGQKSTKYSVDPKSVKVEGAELTATLTNSAPQPPVQFNLTIRAYGPVVRVIVDELPSEHHPRYQIPDILMPGVEQRFTAWADSQATAHTWTGKVGDVTVKLTFATFKLEVLVGGKPALVFNSRAMFNIEHPRTKQVRHTLPRRVIPVVFLSQAFVCRMQASLPKAAQSYRHSGCLSRAFAIQRLQQCHTAVSCSMASCKCQSTNHLLHVPTLCLLELHD